MTPHMKAMHDRLAVANAATEQYAVSVIIILTLKTFSCVTNYQLIYRMNLVAETQRERMLYLQQMVEVS
jgi:hypothetical protein